jgi:hypothetical protein
VSAIPYLGPNIRRRPCLCLIAIKPDLLSRDKIQIRKAIDAEQSWEEELERLPSPFHRLAGRISMQ